MIQSLEEQIEEIENIEYKYPEIVKYLDLYKSILEIRIRHHEELIENNNKILQKISIKDLVEKLYDIDRPLIKMLALDKINFDVYKNIFMDILQLLSQWDPQYNKYVEGIMFNIKSKEMDPEKILKKFLINENTIFLKNRDENTILHFALSMSIRPFVEKLSQKVDKDLKERWWRGWCPICGRKPITARIKKGQKKRYMVCPLCNIEFLVDLFYCPHCENVEPIKFTFINFEHFPEYSIEVCEKCKHYIKVIDENKIKNKIPRGLEDILTIPLDIIAQNEGFKREWILI